MKVVKQTVTTYTLENEGKVVGWIEKQKEGFYKVSVKTTGSDKDEEYVSSFKEAKVKAVELATYWKD